MDMGWKSWRPEVLETRNVRPVAWSTQSEKHEAREKLKVGLYFKGILHIGRVGKTMGLRIWK